MIHATMTTYSWEVMFQTVKCFVMKEGEVAEMCKGRGQARGGRILV